MICYTCEATLTETPERNVCPNGCERVHMGAFHVAEPFEGVVQVGTVTPHWVDYGSTSGSWNSERYRKPLDETHDFRNPLGPGVWRRSTDPDTIESDFLDGLVSYCAAPELSCK